MQLRFFRCHLFQTFWVLSRQEIWHEITKNVSEDCTLISVSHFWLSSCFFRLISDVLDFFVCDLALFSFKHDFLTPAKFAGGADGCFPPWNGTQEQLRFWQFHKVFFVPDVPLLFGIALIHDCWVFGSLSLEETWKPKNRALPLNSHSNQKQRTVNS